jgi:hypothetical protein
LLVALLLLLSSLILVCWLLGWPAFSAIRRRFTASPTALLGGEIGSPGQEKGVVFELIGARNEIESLPLNEAEISRERKEKQTKLELQSLLCQRSL